MRIIPAIDIIDGKCVRLAKGDYNSKKVYNENPLEVAKRFEYHGLQYLHLVDLDGAASNRIVNYRVLEKIATQTNLIIDFGGGLKSDESVATAFNSGASMITGGSVAVTKPEMFIGWLNKYGDTKVILGADARNSKIAVNGWKQTSNLELGSFIQDYLNQGVKYVICTDIEKDGMLEGSAVKLYKKIIQNTIRSKNSIKLIASGGIRSIKDLSKLESAGCEAAIVGKAIYEKRITLEDIEKYILAKAL